MRPISLLAAVFVGAGLAFPAAAAAQTIGSVDKVQATVTAKRDNGSARLRTRSPVKFQDKLVSGEKARLEATLKDGTKLTLGENASLSIDEFVYKPGEEGNKLALNVNGAFLFVGGKIEGPTGGNVDINTPVGTLGVRGTTVWGGPVDTGYGIIVLDGLVTVTTKGGKTVTLEKGQGTMIHDEDGKPSDPVAWQPARLARAVDTITFRK
ncbi:MAG: FecR domain-containing protein [Rhizobiaceae bacterium]|nr:FecR domain-containing protein [Rhizobiaceae bacterium]